jgi:BirA family biotin operon repressor/biotin-[acetyl-CoA-carboxylase] ligase
LPLPVDAQSLGIPFIELQTVGSTNNYALAQIHANLAQPGTCYFAHEQTAGKGQRGKSWATEKEANVILSITLNPGSLQPFQQFHLSACVAVATHHFLNKYVGSELAIKWPNDLFWRGKKLGGILIENVIRGQGAGAATWEWAVVGIGININQTQFSSDLTNPVSLKQIVGQDFDVVKLAKELCHAIDFFYKKLMNQGSGLILSQYNMLLYKKGEMVKLKKGSRIFETTIKGVTETGQLITNHIIEERFEFGEIEWVLKSL